MQMRRVKGGVELKEQFPTLSKLGALRFEANYEVLFEEELWIVI